MAAGYLGVGSRNGETLLTALLRNHLPLDILPRALAPSAFFPASCVSTMTPWLSLQGLSEPLLTVGWAGDLVSEFLTAPFPCQVSLRAWTGLPRDQALKVDREEAWRPLALPCHLVLFS